jgi:PilZ domain
MSPRREKRSFVALPVRAHGKDANGNNFRHPVCTLDLSPNGARINGLHSLTVGQELTLEYQGNKIRFEVVWVGQSGTSRAGQAGLRALDPDKRLADVQFDPAEFVDTWKTSSTT